MTDHEEFLDDLPDGDPAEGSPCQCVAVGCICCRLVPDALAGDSRVCLPCSQGDHSSAESETPAAVAGAGVAGVDGDCIQMTFPATRQHGRPPTPRRTATVLRPAWSLPESETW